MMRLLRDPAAVKEVEDPAIRDLLAQRFTEISPEEPYSPVDHGYFVLVEPGDTIDAVEEETKVPVLHGHEGWPSYGDPDFSPWWEWLEEHPTCFEAVFILSDSGFAVVVVIPKQSGVDPALLAACTEFATRAA